MWVASIRASWRPEAGSTASTPRAPGRPTAKTSLSRYASTNTGITTPASEVPTAKVSSQPPARLAAQ